MTRKSVARTSLSLLAMLCFCTATSCRENGEAAQPETGKQHPNILLISVDTLRPDHLSCYGYDRPTSPNIDRLAAAGALFENAISSTSWTLPAHAALMTGLSDSVHGCVDTDRRLADNRRTLAERLKGAGYATIGFFTGPYLHPVFGLGQGFDEYVDCTSYAGLNTQTAAATGKVDEDKVHEASHRDMTNPQLYQRVSGWLKVNRARPFFMFVHMWDVHFDFIPPPPYDTKFDPDYRGTLTGENFLFNTAINETMPRRDLEHLIALYDGEIAWTDAHIGKILDDLDALGLRDNTIVLLVSDHGTEFFEHRLKGHRQSLYDEVIRIPMLVRYPGSIKPGGRFEQQVRIIDVLPTVMDLAGLDTPPEIMGQSLTPLLSGERLPKDDLAIAELLCDSVKLRPDGRWERKDPRFPIGMRLRAFRRTDHKLINDMNLRQAEAYDLSADPGEQHPLAEPRAAALKDAEQGRARLKAYIEALPSEGAESEIPPDVLAKLKSLGYIGDDVEEEDADEREP